MTLSLIPERHNIDSLLSVGTKRKPHWPVRDKIRAMSLEAFVALFSFPFLGHSLHDIVAPQRRCANCSSRFITTLEEARVHARAPNGLAIEATPSLHRCLRCHELTVFPSIGLEEGRVMPFDRREDWLDDVYPGMPRC